MKRLIVGSLVSVPLMLTACSGDPTESLRNGIAQLTTSPSELFVQQSRTAKVRVSAIDEQGNQIVTSFDASDVGSGINVSRDLTFQPLFVNDSTLQPPAEAAVFQFNVNAVEYGPDQLQAQRRREVGRCSRHRHAGPGPNCKPCRRDDCRGDLRPTRRQSP